MCMYGSGDTSKLRRYVESVMNESAIIIIILYSLYLCVLPLFVCGFVLSLLACLFFQQVSKYTLHDMSVEKSSLL